MKTPVESYVVRIYRRRSEGTPELAGVVEGPRHSAPQAFATVEQLWEILSCSGLVSCIEEPAKAVDESSAANELRSSPIQKGLTRSSEF